MDALLHNLVSEGIVKYNPDGFKLKSGAISKTYFDIRDLISCPYLSTLLSIAIYDRIKDIEFEHICGVAYAGIPIATQISVTADIPMLMVRKEVKTHGTGKRVEGRFKPGDRVVIFDDVVTSGTSLREVIAILEGEGLVIAGIVVCVERSNGQHGFLNLRYLWTLAELEAALAN